MPVGPGRGRGSSQVAPSLTPQGAPPSGDADGRPSGLACACELKVIVSLSREPGPYFLPTIHGGEMIKKLERLTHKEI